MKRISVNSSNLSSVEYDPVTQTLEIAFHNGGVYQYSNVPESVYNGLMSAGSKGRYHHINIKNNYPYRRV